MRLASMWIKQKKNILFFHPNFHFFFEKNAGSSTGKFRIKKCEKTRSKILWSFALKSWGGLRHVQYYCGILFYYSKKYPESLEYLRPLCRYYGRLLLWKLPKISTKMAQNMRAVQTSQVKMLLDIGATQKKIIQNVFICFNIVPL